MRLRVFAALFTFLTNSSFAPPLRLRVFAALLFFFPNKNAEPSNDELGVSHLPDFVRVPAPQGGRVDPPCRAPDSVQVCPGLIACMHGQRVNGQLRAGSSRYRHKQVSCVALWQTPITMEVSRSFGLNHSNVAGSILDIDSMSNSLSRCAHCAPQPPSRP